MARGNVRAHLLATEPALAPLIREVALSGRPSEYALSVLADARPLLVEFDPTFDRAQLEHLIPQAFFLRFAPQPLGRSDRQAGLQQALPELRDVISQSEQAGIRDQATRGVLLAAIRGQALVAAALNDRKNLADILSAAHLLDQSDALARELDAEANSRLLGKPSSALGASWARRQAEASPRSR